MALCFAKNAENDGDGHRHGKKNKFPKICFYHTSRLAAEQFDRLLTLRATNPVAVTFDRAALEERVPMLGMSMSVSQKLAMYLLDILDIVGADF